MTEDFLNTNSTNVYTQYDSDFAKSLNSTFYWYNKLFFQKVSKALSEFLRFDFGLKLISISEKDNFFFSGNEFFVTKVNYSKGISIFFRMSSEMMNFVLESALGKRKGDFSPDLITELEAKVLTACNNFVYKDLTDFFNVKEFDKDMPLAHFTFFTKAFDEEFGKYVISIPSSILPDVNPKAEKQTFTLDSFPDICTKVDIYAGKTNIMLSELKNIEVEDIVILDDSNVKRMRLDFNGESAEINVLPNPDIIESVDEEETKQGGKVSDKAKNMWDVIPVDVSAEFEKVKMTLGEIKTISEGSVIDLASVYENKVFLKVETKPVAAGELIIINDKYAVRVTDVFSDGDVKSNESHDEEASFEENSSFDGENIGEYSGDVVEEGENFEEGSVTDDEFSENVNEDEDFDIEDENI